jgi:hypothetical protein
MPREIAQRLAETVAWCSRHARADDADSSTRSLALRPPVMALPDSKPLYRLLDVPGEARAAVEFVCESRRSELARLGIPVDPVGSDLAGGLILLTTIDTDSCEAATEPSNGYYDLNDLPGWDTWFLHSETDGAGGAIYCWVPGALVELAQRGMDVIPVKSVQWAQTLEL